MFSKELNFNFKLNEKYLKTNKDNVIITEGNVINSSIDLIFSINTPLKNSQLKDIVMNMNKINTNNNNKNSSLFALNINTGIIISQGNESNESEVIIINSSYSKTPDISSKFSIDQNDAYNFLIKTPQIKVPNFLPTKEKIVLFTCNDNTFHLINRKGELFSWGDDNLYKTGILGLGNVYKVSTPTKNEGLKAPIKFVSLSDKHCVATTFDGEVYTWGSGNIGELIEKNGYNVANPVSVKLTSTSTKAIAGSGYTAILSSKGGVYYYGKITQKLGLNSISSGYQKNTSTLQNLQKSKSKMKLSLENLNSNNKISNHNYGTSISNLNNSIISKNQILGLTSYFIVDIIPGSNVIAMISNEGKIFIYNEELRVQEIKYYLEVEKNKPELINYSYKLENLVFYTNDFLINIGFFHENQKIGSYMLYYKFQTHVLREDCSIGILESYSTIDINYMFERLLKENDLFENSSSFSEVISQLKEFFLNCLLVSNEENKEQFNLSKIEIKDNSDLICKFINNMIIFDTPYLVKTCLLAVSQNKILTTLKSDIQMNQLDEKELTMLEKNYIETENHLKNSNFINPNTAKSQKIDALEDIKASIVKLREKVKNNNHQIKNQTSNDPINNVKDYQIFPANNKITNISSNKMFNDLVNNNLVNIQNSNPELHEYYTKRVFNENEELSSFHQNHIIQPPPQLQSNNIGKNYMNIDSSIIHY